MRNEDGRVTILPTQFSRLAELFAHGRGAIEVKQYGSVLEISDSTIKFKVNANGDDIPPPNQESLC